MSRRFPRILDGNARCRLMFPVSVCLAMEKRDASLKLSILSNIRAVLGTGEWDNTRHESYRLSEILNSKGIKHWLDDGKWRGHEWSYWRDMLPYYLSKL